jgi:cation transport ATPase
MTTPTLASAGGAIETPGIALQEQPKAIGRHLDVSVLHEHVFSTYLSLRRLLALTGFMFPLVLLGVGWLTRVEVQTSMSAYYHADAVRDFFVGGQFLVAGLLASYRGYSPAENSLLNCAALLTMIVAIFPTCDTCGAVTLHGAAAIGFFIAIACVMIFCSGQTLEHLEEGKRRAYSRAYYACAAVMLAGIGAALVLNWVGEFKEWVLAAEWVGIWAFSTYWLIKTSELRASGILRKRACRPATGGQESVSRAN